MTIDLSNKMYHPYDYKLCLQNSICKLVNFKDPIIESSNLSVSFLEYKQSKELGS